MINDYFNKINNIISSFSSIIKSYTKTEKVYSNNIGFISGKIIFTDDFMLSFMELKNTTKNHKNKYNYHFMDNLNNLIFRYDNAEYHRDISTFPHHKHIPQTILPASEPELINVLIEIHKIRFR